MSLLIVTPVVSQRSTYSYIFVVFVTFAVDILPGSNLNSNKSTYFVKAELALLYQYRATELLLFAL